MPDPSGAKRITVPALHALKGKRRFAAMTAYDFPTARLLDEAGIDLLLVGDSLGMVVQGRESTLPVTIDEMLYHVGMVARAARRALVVADMPFLSYQAGLDRAVENAGRFLKESGAAAVKLEGGTAVADVVERLARYDIPVMGHVGLTPQSVHRMGGYRVQRDAGRILADAEALEGAGAFCVVLEGIPAAIARTVTTALSVPTLGIGAGPDCDGQVLVFHDVVGMSDVRPKFAKRYAELGDAIRDAASAFRREVEAGTFPAPEHCYD